MKLFKNLLVVIILFTGVTAVQAQSKVAHINTEMLVSAMPQTKVMQDELKKIAQTYDTEYKTQGNALQAKMKKYDAEAGTQTDAENQKRMAEVQGLQQKLTLYAQTAQKELQQKEQDLYKPIVEAAQKAIKDVATAKGFQYVMDSSPGKGLLVFTGEDLLVAVKANLNIK